MQSTNDPDREAGEPREPMEAYFDRLRRFFGRSKYAGFHIAVAGNRPLHRIAYAVAQVAVRHRITTFLVVTLLYLLLPGLRHVPSADIVFFGETQNNRRALDEVGRLLVGRRDLHMAFASRRAGLLDRLHRWAAFGNIRRASALIARYQRAAPFLSMQLLIGAAAFAFYQDRLARQSCKMIVLANDHSPVPAAIMFSARHRGIATVYRQHAPVTAEFPPLRCDLALLYDQVSCDAYRAAEGHGVQGKTHTAIVSPFEESCRPIDPACPLTTVGICLSLVWTAGAVEQLIDELLGHGPVKRIILRPHPANQQNLSCLLKRPGVALDIPGAPVSAFASTINLAIVPNSGICIELLHRGVPVAYMAGLDALGHDLYGFVEAGIVPDYTRRRLAEERSLYTFYDAAWRERFARFDATQSLTPEAMWADARRALDDLLRR